MENKELYQEKQSFSTWWLFAIIALILGYGIYELHDYYLVNATLILPTGIWLGLTLLLFFAFVKLKTEIDKTGIHIRFFPFLFGKKSFRWDEIGEVYVRKYSLAEYGGWGWRIGPSGVAYNTAGYTGIQLILKNGRRVLIGTHKPIEVQTVLEKLNKLKTHEED
ncbi:hypothetical protein [Sphingobacterium hungaricum]|uniref:Uncharacterized protein n=1 Tax=Sphingobacterium hungaricum TaxID=2082723 RepID=A0A928UUM7_9SPHI|nr:hypothetical protein [Sphingobacterium hungaricum]MBE8713530.1 hypothetical protein [Sphingobacterium hungaricum]